MSSENNKKHIEQGARTRLLEAGVKLFSEKGYANTSVREIVELAGVSKPILYYYFKSKEGMFRSIMDYVLSATTSITLLCAMTSLTLKIFTKVYISLS